MSKQQLRDQENRHAGPRAGRQIDALAWRSARESACLLRNMRNWESGRERGYETLEERRERERQVSTTATAPHKTQPRQQRD